MHRLDYLLENNERWAESLHRENPEFFDRLAAGQQPLALWIGCSDSRIPETHVTGLQPGQLFVHRNIANQVDPTDLSILSALQFAIETLKVQHVIVCGHYGCGGVQAAAGRQSLGIIDAWLRPIKDLSHRHAHELDAIPEERARLDRLCELNAIGQVHNVCHTAVVQRAWARGQALSIHGWMFRLHDGRLKDLEVTVVSPDGIPDIYRYDLPAAVLEG